MSVLGFLTIEECEDGGRNLAIDEIQTYDLRIHSPTLSPWAMAPQIIIKRNQSAPIQERCLCFHEILYFFEGVCRYLVLLILECRYHDMNKKRFSDTRSF